MVTAYDWRARTLLLAACAAHPAAAQDDTRPVQTDSEIVVTGAYARAEELTTTAAKLPVDPHDLPLAVQIVTSELIRDRAVTDIADAVRTVSGAVNATDFSGSQLNLTLRGFELDQRNNYLRDGVRVSFYGLSDVVAVDRIEVLKGPASVLYGRAEPGGIVNVISKQPTRDTSATVELQVESDSRVRPTIDLDARISEHGMVRLNAAYEHDRHFTGGTRSDRFVVAPSIAYEPAAGIRLTASAERLKQDQRGAYYGLPIIGDRPARVPRDTFLNESNGRVRYLHLLLTGRLEVELAEYWNLRVTGQRTDQNFRERTNVYTAAFGPLAPGERLLQRTLENFPQRYRGELGQVELTGKLDVLGTTHRLLAGVERGRTRSGARGQGIFEYTPIDIFMPVRNLGLVPGGFEFLYYEGDEQRILGAYGQDLIEIGERWKLLAGVRYDDFRVIDQSDVDSGSGQPATTPLETTGSALSPRLGIVLQPVRAVSLYTSWSRSFAPVAPGTRLPGRQRPEPIRSEQVEAGVKLQTIDGRLAGTLAAFQITKQGVVTPNLNDATGLSSLQVGEQHSRGVELDLTAAPVTGLSLVASGALTDAEITRDNDLPVGNQLANAPRRTASLWASYDLPGTLKGWRVGGGVFHFGKREGDILNRFQLPAYTRIDAFVGYRADPWDATLNLRNLTDTYYFEGASAGVAFPGEPLAAAFRLAARF